MKKITCIVCVILCTIVVYAQKLTQNDSKTTVEFKIKNFGFYVDCKFTKIKFDVGFNKNDLANSYINATIDVASVDTNNETRNEHLQEKKYFDTKKYPKIILKSTKIQRVDNDLYNLTGNLTIKGTTKEITIPIKVVDKDESIEITSDFTLNRLDYKVGKSSFVLSKSVIVKVNYFGTK